MWAPFAAVSRACGSLLLEREEFWEIEQHLVAEERFVGSASFGKIELTFGAFEGDTFRDTTRRALRKPRESRAAPTWPVSSRFTNGSRPALTAFDWLEREDVSHDTFFLSQNSTESSTRRRRVCELGVHRISALRSSSPFLTSAAAACSESLNLAVYDRVIRCTCGVCESEGSWRPGCLGSLERLYDGERSLGGGALTNSV